MKNEATWIRLWDALDHALYVAETRGTKPSEVETAILRALVLAVELRVRKKRRAA